MLLLLRAAIIIWVVPAFSADVLNIVSSVIGRVVWLCYDDVRSVSEYE